MSPLVATAIYASLALFALAGTWGTEGKRQVGVMLFACWVASNVVFWTLPVEYRPSIFPILDVLFALMAAKAGKETGSRVPIALIALSVMAVVINTAFAWSGGQYLGQIHFYEISLNAVFALQCLITGGWGIADALGRVRDFLGRAYHHRGTAEPVSHRDKT